MAKKPSREEAQRRAEDLMKKTLYTDPIEPLPKKQAKPKTAKKVNGKKK